VFVPLVCIAVTRFSAFADTPEMKWLTVRLQFIRCADDDGKHACDFTWADVMTLMGIANRIYSVAKVKFVCDPHRDFVDVRNTAVNSQDVVSSPLADQGAIEGNKLVEKYRGKLVVFCRYGASKGPTGTGFSGRDLFAVFLPSLRHTNAGTWLLAHEMGHYFGMSHTFRVRMRSVEQAEQYLKDHGGNLNVFDGDGFSDTPPDPGFSPPKGEPRDSMVLNGVRVQIPYGNIMSYMNWPGHEWLSPQQIDCVREYCSIRQSVGMGWQSNAFDPGILEAEDLEPTYAGGCAGEVQGMNRFNRHRWSGNAQLFCHSPSGGSVTLHFQHDRASTVELCAYMTMARDYGVVRFFLDGIPVGRTFDGFAPIVVSSGRISLGRQAISCGWHSLRIEVVGKNVSATGTNFGVDGIAVREVLPPWSDSESKSP